MERDAIAPVTAALLGLDGFEVLAAAEAGGELEVLIETTADLVPCPGCFAVARAKDRRATWVRDLPIGGRPVVLCWIKRIWCCRHPACEVKTWTERHPAIAPRAAVTERARAEAAGQVGSGGSSVARQARCLGVGWQAVMRQVHALATPLIADPARLEGVSRIGVDEHVWQHARPGRRTRYVTSITDLSPGRPPRLLDLVEGRSGAVLAGWLAQRGPDWCARIEVAALDAFRGYATALTRQLPGATRVLDAFHVVRVRREAPCVQVGCKDPPLVCRSRPVELRAA